MRTSGTSVREWRWCGSARATVLPNGRHDYPREGVAKCRWGHPTPAPGPGSPSGAHSEGRQRRAHGEAMVGPRRRPDGVRMASGWRPDGVLRDLGLVLGRGGSWPTGVSAKGTGMGRDARYQGLSKEAVVSPGGRRDPDADAVLGAVKNSRCHRASASEHGVGWIPCQEETEGTMAAFLIRSAR